MQKKLLLTYIILIIVTMIFAVGLTWSRINDYFFDRVESETQGGEAAILHKVIEEFDVSADELPSFVDEYAEIADVRITLIDNYGEVIADSDNDLGKMDNHGNRPEVIGAFGGGQPTSNTRYSNTMKMYFFSTTLLKLKVMLLQVFLEYHFLLMRLNK